METPGLFAISPTQNLLPGDGEVYYHGPVVSRAQARHYLEVLLAAIPWKNDELVMFGRPVVTARQVAWFGDREFSYTYSGSTKRALVWTKELLALKAVVEERTGASYNSCLLNLYHHGGEGMGWHSDDERALGKNSIIASVSFGAERRFCFRHRQDSASKFDVWLENGSLLVMQGATQTHWQHSLPKSAKITEPRVNLTFRTIVLA